MEFMEKGKSDKVISGQWKINQQGKIIKHSKISIVTIEKHLQNRNKVLP